MIDIKNIFPECYADTFLVEKITGKRNPYHCHNLSKVVKALKDKADKFQRLIGLVDSDKFKRPEENKYLTNFSELVCDLKNEEEGIVVWKIPSKAHYIIFIHPAFEVWILKQAKLVNIRLTDFGINSKEAFINHSKHYNTRKNSDFENFVKAVVNANPKGIELLRSYLMVN